MYNGTAQRKVYVQCFSLSIARAEDTASQGFGQHGARLRTDNLSSFAAMLQGVYCI